MRECLNCGCEIEIGEYCLECAIEINNDYDEECDNE